jgi:hypothetical protein
MTKDKNGLDRFSKIQTEVEDWTHMCENCGNPMMFKKPVDDDGWAIMTNLPFRYCETCDIFKLFMDEDPRVL